MFSAFVILKSNDKNGMIVNLTFLYAVMGLFVEAPHLQGRLRLLQRAPQLLQLPLVDAPHFCSTNSLQLHRNTQPSRSCRSEVTFHGRRLLLPHRLHPLAVTRLLAPQLLLMSTPQLLQLQIGSRIRTDPTQEKNK